jgi:hypothetical protein
MPLQFFDDIANKTHGDRLKAGGAIAKSFYESHICFSTPEQTKGDSFRRQTTQTVEFCQKHNLALNETRFEDLGVSGWL